MADDDLLALAQQLGGAAGNEAMAGAVEAVAADSVLLIILHGDAVHIGHGGHGLMESGVEYGYLGRAGHNGFAGIDAHEICGVVEGAQGDAVFDGLFAGFIDDAGSGELVAAVENAVAYRADFGYVCDYAVILVNQSFENQLDGCGVVGESGFNNVFLLSVLTVLVGELTHGKTDALGKTLGDYGVVGHVEQLIFKGRRTGVDNENFHYYFSFWVYCAWTAVIATVATISSTLQPRERSLQGFAIP